MQTDYKNWVPKGMVKALALATCICAVFLFVLTVAVTVAPSTARWLGFGVFLTGFLVCGIALLWAVTAYRAFSFTGKRQLSRQIIDGVASYVNLPENAKGLDVGCGSGALTIACAKRNPKAHFTGVDRWGKEYADYSQALCFRNAMAEGVNNAFFRPGDANALPFADETFDAVVSNYVYHNIAGKSKQALLLESLRVLKKGGTFAIHDLMSPMRYGDMNAFRQKLLDMGYEKVDLIDTTKIFFRSPAEAHVLGLKGSTLLLGKK